MAGNPALFRDVLLVPTGRGPARLGAVQAPFQVRDFAALDPAFLALARGGPPQPGRFWLERTKGASKDTDAAVMLCWLLAFGRRPLTCQVGAADQDQAGELRKAAQDLLRLNRWLAEAVTIQSWAIFNPRTEARCEIIAADVAGSHGARPDLLILNELTHITRQDFALNLLDNASKVPAGVVLVATNAGLVPSWQHDLREMARTSPGRWYFSAVTQPAPWLPAAEVEEARRRNSGNRFRRLCGGEWPSASGDALSEEDVKAAVTLKGAPPPAPGLAYFGGIDLGVSKDHAAVCVLGRDRARRLRLVRLYAWEPPQGGKIDLTDVRAAILEADAVYRPLWIADPWQMELMLQELQQARGVRVELQPFTGSACQEMASGLIETFTARMIDLWDDRQLVADLKALCIVESASGWRLSAPRTGRGGHADRAVALVLALLSARRHPWHQPPPDPEGSGPVLLTRGRSDPCRVDWDAAVPFFSPGNRTGAYDGPDPRPDRPRTFDRDW
jgi:hypothetical protein